MKDIGVTLANPGTTGTAAHDAVVPPGSVGCIIVFEIEAVGATPTITFIPSLSVEGNVFGPTPYNVGDNVAEVTAAQTKTAVGRYIMSFQRHRFAGCRKVRVTTSANTNVTYSSRASFQVEERT